jgi:geranylgeranyl pyrophosphate synthase
MKNLNKTNSIQKSLNLAEKYSQTALKSIENLNTPELEKIVYKLMQRDH